MSRFKLLQTKLSPASRSHRCGNELIASTSAQLAETLITLTEPPVLHAAVTLIGGSGTTAEQLSLTGGRRKSFISASVSSLRPCVCSVTEKRAPEAASSTT